jgi:flagellar basal-body rod protein FlgB
MKQIEGEAPVFVKLEVTRMAQALSSHSAARQAAVAENIAHADTPGYEAKDMPGFAAAYQATAEGTMRATRPGHISTAPGSPEALNEATMVSPSPNGNTVSLETEMVRAVEVKQQHDMALAVYRTVSDIVRTSLGRR